MVVLYFLFDPGLAFIINRMKIVCAIITLFTYFVARIASALKPKVIIINCDRFRFIGYLVLAMMVEGSKSEEFALAGFQEAMEKSNIPKITYKILVGMSTILRIARTLILRVMPKNDPRNQATSSLRSRLRRRVILGL